MPANYYGETNTKAPQYPPSAMPPRIHRTYIYVSTRALLVYARTRVWLWYIIEYEVAGRVGMLIPWLSPAAAGSPIRPSVCMFVRHRVRLFRTDSNDSPGSHQFDTNHDRTLSS